jgi:heavy metal sensor kinase
MKSIRGTLLLYFLALVALVLGAVSFYVYSVAAADMHAKDSRMQQLLEIRYEARCNDVREKFDEETLRRAQQLGRVLATQWGQPLQRLYPLGILTDMTHTQGHFGLYGWLSQGIDNNLLAWMIQRMHTIQFISDQFFAQDGEGHEQDFFQIWSDQRKPSSLLRSRELEQDKRDLPLKRDNVRRLKSLEFAYHDADLDPGYSVRIVTLKVPLYKSQFVHSSPFGLPLPPPMGRRGGSPQAGGRGAPPPSNGNSGGTNNGASLRWNPQRTPPVQSNPSILIQYARDTHARDTRIAAFRQELLADQEKVRAETNMALAYLRDKLILLCLVTFSLTVLGGALLGQLGLRPLGRIAEAVSHVSERDFHLRIDDREVPMEMMPIVRRLQESLQSLEKAFEHEKQAVADISHELRTPIASLMATMQVSLRKQRSAAEYRKAMENCLEIADHLNQLVEQLLTLARLDAGSIPINTELVDVTELADQCAEMIRPLAEEQGLALYFTPLGTVETETDAGKLKEIVTNLLSNAVQYNRPQGEITLQVQQTEAEVCISVTDTGIGIPEENRKHLFERFYRADPSRHADTVHAGLGLSIVKGYVDLLGGTIAVESVPDKGSTFRVCLPLHVPAETLAVS